MRSLLVFAIIFFGGLRGAFAAESSPDVFWRRTVEDLGFRQGATAAGLAETATIYWQIPTAGRGQPGLLSLDLTSLVPPGFAARANLFVDGDAVSALALPAGRTAQTVGVAVSAAASADGLVRLDVGLRAASGPDRCRDERLGGASLTVAPRSSLELNIPHARFENVEAAFETLPHTLRIALPKDGLGADEYAEALRSFAALKSDGHAVAAIGDPEDADIILRPGAEAATLAVASSGRLTLTLPVSGPTFEALMGILAARLAPAPDPDRAGVPFTVFGGAVGTRWSASDAAWILNVPLRRAPPGTQPKALVVDLSTPADRTDTAHLVHVFLNGQLIKSEQLRPKGRLHHLGVALPQGALALDNEVRVVFERLERAPACLGRGASLPVTLHDSSRVVFGPPSTAPEQFLDLIPDFASGVALILPASYAARAGETLDPVSDLLSDLGASPWPLAISWGAATPDRLRRPFLAVADTLPAGARFPLRQDRGAATIVSPDGRALLTVDDAPGTAIAQLASFEGTPGLWLRAPTIPVRSAAEPLSAAHGDLLILDPKRTDFFLSSAAKRGPAIQYAITAAPIAFAHRYWRFALGTFWVVLTVMTALGLVRGRLRK